jgi:hypothetical protein
MLLRTWLLSVWRPSLLQLPAHDEMETAGRPGRSGIARHDGLRTPPPPPLPRAPTPPIPPVRSPPRSAALRRHPSPCLPTQIERPRPTTSTRLPLLLPYDGRPVEALFAGKPPPTRPDGPASLALALGGTCRRRGRSPLVGGPRAVPRAHRDQGALFLRSTDNRRSSHAQAVADRSVLGGGRQLDGLRTRFGLVLDDGWGKVVSVDDEREAYYAAVDMLLLLRQSSCAASRHDAQHGLTLLV